MPVKKVVANPLVAADRDRVALQRGPLVYCLEWPDNQDGHVLNLLLDSTTELKSSFNPDLLNGVEVIHGKASVPERNENGKLFLADQSFTAIPYYAWANRGAGEMEVWVASEISAARPVPLPTISSRSKVSGSTQGRSLKSVNDLDLPSHSNDHDVLYFHWWPKKDTTEWIQYDFTGKTKVSECSVYWFDDGPWGGCRVPSAWRILYKSGKNWVPVKVKGKYPITKDRLDEVSFKAVTTEALRLEVSMQKEFSTGVYEWIVK
jgi:hypothetical protein